jgi:hypothetical protein
VGKDENRPELFKGKMAAAPEQEELWMKAT